MVNDKPLLRSIWTSIINKFKKHIERIISILTSIHKLAQNEKKTRTQY